MSTYTLVYIHVNECGYFMYTKYNYIYMSTIEILYSYMRVNANFPK